MKASSRLRQFRRSCEKEAARPAHQIKVPLLNVLNDVCCALRLSKTQRRKVLGRHGVVRLTHDRPWTATLIDDTSQAN